MRSYTHVIDTKAIKHVLNSIPDHWVVRDLSERDYGIDLMVEIFSESGKDKNGHPQYRETGRVCYLQVKGTEKPEAEDGENVCFSIKKHTLLYVERFSTPFLLVRVYTNSSNEKVAYYCWIQRYILNKLDMEKPDWRESKQKAFSIRIPKKNNLQLNTLKIEKIAGRIKYIEELVEFYERYGEMFSAFDLMIQKKFSRKQYDSFITDLKRIKNLTALLDLNYCQVNQDGIDSLIKFVTKIRNGKAIPSSIEEFPHPIMYNLELLLNDILVKMKVEEFIAENDDETVY